MAQAVRRRRRIRRGRPVDAVARVANVNACRRCCGGGPCNPGTVLGRLNTVKLGRYTPRVPLLAANPPEKAGIYRITDRSGVTYSVGKAKNLRRRIGQHQDEARRLNVNRDVSWALLPLTGNLAIAEACEKCRSRPTRDQREFEISRRFERAFEREL